MKYAVDSITDNIVTLENIYTKKIIYEDISKFSFNVKEKDIVKKENDEYFLDDDEKEKRIKRIKEKMEKLKENNI